MTGQGKAKTNSVYPVRFFRGQVDFCKCSFNFSRWERRIAAGDFIHTGDAINSRPSDIVISVHHNSFCSLLRIASPYVMKIKDANSGLLSNFELIELLRSRGATQDPLGSFGSATHSECKVFDYLVQSAACNQTLESVQDFLLKVEKFSLTKAERLQVLNLRPFTAVEVHLIVEDCEERMPSSVVDELLETVRNTLPPPPEKPEEEEENAEADEENDEDMDDAGAEEQEE